MIGMIPSNANTDAIMGSANKTTRYNSLKAKQRKGFPLTQEEMEEIAGIEEQINGAKGKLALQTI